MRPHWSATQKDVTHSWYWGFYLVVYGTHDALFKSYFSSSVLVFNPFYSETWILSSIFLVCSQNSFSPPSCLISLEGVHHTVTSEKKYVGDNVLWEKSVINNRHLEVGWYSCERMSLIANNANCRLLWALSWGNRVGSFFFKWHFLKLLSSFYGPVLSTYLSVSGICLFLFHFPYGHMLLKQTSRTLWSLL